MGRGGEDGERRRRREERRGGEERRVGEDFDPVQLRKLHGSSLSKRGTDAQELNQFIQKIMDQLERT